MNNRDCAVGTIDRTQKGQDDRVVSAKSYNTRVVLSIDGYGNERVSRGCIVPERRERSAVKKLLVTLFNLLDSKFVVVRSDRNIPTVDDLEAR